MTRTLHTEIKSGERLVATDITDLTFFPKGTILTFSSEAYNATSAAFKEIWKICNGTNNTPNLVNKFLRGSTTSGTTGGADSVTLAEKHIPVHSHGLSSISVTGGDHDHTFSGTNASGYLPIGEGDAMAQSGGMNGVFTYQNGYRWGFTTEVVGGRGIKFSMTPSGTISKVGHTHTLSGSTNSYGQGNTDVPTVPGYYSVIYIMKIA
ncbi:MAG: hypothetical protein LBK68_02255 [Candidatus Margulisbacteria bacterium]|nr:hypothetical protein [Candidatus Margulisiibacteriota bacterium]